MSIVSPRVTPQLLQVVRRPHEVRTPGEPFADVRRVVVIRSDRLGDAILTLPAVAALRCAYPEVRMAWMVAPAVAPLARMARDVDEVLEASPRAEVMRRRLAEFGAELVVCISRDTVAAWAAFRAGVPHRVGSGRRVFSGVFHRTVIERRRAGALHECEYALSFAHRAGAAAGPTTFGLDLPQDSRGAVDRWLGEQGVEGPFTVVHPGSGGSCPRWPLRSFLELATRLADRGVHTVVSVGPGDALPPSVEGQGIARFEGSLPRLAVLLDRAGLLIGNSSGPVHLAAALGTPTLALHAPWSTCGVARWGPYQRDGWGIVAHASCAANWSARRRRRDGDALMAGIAVEQVQRCALALLAGEPPRLNPSTA